MDATIKLISCFRKNMVNHGFDMYRVFISTPGDLLREQDACRAAISEVNAGEAMPRKVLLVSVGLREDAQVEAFRSAVSENVRGCAYFLQVFQDDWGPKNLFRKMLFLAAECRDDPAMPMREIAVFLKEAPHETDPGILALRKELEELAAVRLFHFDKPESLKTQLLEVCRGWVRSIVDAGGGAQAG